MVIPLSRNLVSASDLRRLTHGSYEYKIHALHAQVMEEVATRVNTPLEDLEVVATHPDHVVVQSPDGFYSVQLENSDTGTLHVTRCVEEDVGVYDGSNVEVFIEAGIDAALTLYFKGDVGGALTKLSEVAGLVPDTLEGAQDQAISTVEGVLGRHRVWKRLFEGRRSHIQRFIVNFLPALEEARLVPKFTELYEGTSEDDNLSAYGDIVSADLGYVLKRYADLEDTLRTRMGEAADRVAEARGADVVELYEKFATDLLDDVQSVNKFATRVALKLTQIKYRGKLRDALVERLHRYEVAGCFVTEVASRFKAA